LTVVVKQVKIWKGRHKYAGVGIFLQGKEALLRYLPERTLSKGCLAMAMITPDLESARMAVTKMLDLETRLKSVGATDYFPIYQRVLVTNGETYSARRAGCRMVVTGTWNPDPVYLNPEMSGSIISRSKAYVENPPAEAPQIVARSTGRGRRCVDFSERRE